MPTNIEKLAEELNALTDYDPMALECTEATVSQAPGELHGKRRLPYRLR